MSKRKKYPNSNPIEIPKSVAWFVIGCVMVIIIGLAHVAFTAKTNYDSAPLEAPILLK